MKNLTISVNIMTYNEERCIERCIKSIKKLADEIIIIDTGSTDKTIEIIKSIKCNKIKLYHHIWEYDFAKIRNLMIQYSTGDIIFQIDADEYINDSIQNKTIIYDNIKYSEVLSPKIIDYYDTEYIGDLGRIFLNNNKYTYFGKVHEELRNNNKSICAKKINLNIYHDGYLQDIIKSKNKGNRNIELCRQMVSIEPDNCRWEYHLIKDLFNYSNDTNELISLIDLFIKKYEEKKYRILSDVMLEVVTYIKVFCIINNNLDIPYDIEKLIKKYNRNTDFIFLKLLELKKQINIIEDEISNIIEVIFTLNNKYSYFNKKNNHIFWLISEFLLNFKKYKKFMIISNKMSSRLKIELYKSLFTDISVIYNFLKGELQNEK